MTKRYNMFNYLETYFGILACVSPVLMAWFLYTVFHNNPETPSIIIIIICLITFAICAFSIIPKGIKLIKQGINKAYNCNDDYIFGRVRSDEATERYINNLDFLKALEYCNRKGCSHCPFRISCRRTFDMWMIQSARLHFDKLEPSEDLNRIAQIIDKYNNCKKDKICADCPSYDNECLENQIDSLQHRIYLLFKKQGFTSASQLRSK